MSFKIVSMHIAYNRKFTIISSRKFVHTGFNSKTKLETTLLVMNKWANHRAAPHRGMTKQNKPSVQLQTLMCTATWITLVAF